MNLTIVTQNTKRGRAQLRNAGVLVNRQEMQTAASHRRLQKKRRYWHTPEVHGTPAPRQFLTISGRTRRCKLLHSGWVKVHAGETHQTPARGIEWAVVAFPRDRILIDINPWPINGGWKPGKFGREAAWRELLWGAYIETMRRLIRDLRDQHPDAEVVVAGDLNWPTRVNLPGVRLIARNGVDHIYASKGLRKRRVWRLPRWGSDHRPLKARLSWRKK